MEQGGIQARLVPLESGQVVARLGKPEGLVLIAPDVDKVADVLTEPLCILGELGTPGFPRLVSLLRADEILPYARVRRSR